MVSSLIQFAYLNDMILLSVTNAKIVIGKIVAIIFVCC